MRNNHYIRTRRKNQKHSTMQKIYRRLLTCAILLAALPCWGAEGPLNVKGKEAMGVGIIITDLSTGETLREYQSEKVFTPASILKSFTTATATSLLPTDFRFETPVYVTGDVEGGVLNGDLVVEATGDATIESSHFKNKGFCDSIVAALLREGVREINGNCTVTSSGYWADDDVIPQWEVEDVAWSYGTGLHAFNYKDNNFVLTLKTGKTRPAIESLIVEDNTTSGDDGPVLMRGSKSYLLNIYGKVPKDDSYAINCSMPFPDDVFLDELMQKLQAAGIEVTGDMESGLETGTKAGKTIYTHRSPLLKDIMHSLMIRSDNLFAESVLRLIARGKSRDEAIKKELATWKSRGIDCGYSYIYDGCGLARTDKISPKMLAGVLRWMANSEYGRDYVSLFPVCGKEGTVTSFLKGTKLEGAMALKTGSMSGVQCYAGYKLDKSGKPTHAVVIMVNNFFCSRAELKKATEKYLLDAF